LFLVDEGAWIMVASTMVPVAIIICLHKSSLPKGANRSNLLNVTFQEFN
jgi:hypothetical protein